MMGAKITFFLLVCGIAYCLAVPGCTDDDFYRCFKNKTGDYPTNREEFKRFCRTELDAVTCAINLIESCPNSKYASYLDSLELELQLKVDMCEIYIDKYSSEASCSDDAYFQCFKDKSSKYPTTLEEFDEHCRRELHAVRCGIDLLEKCPNSRYRENLESLEKELEVKEWMCKRFRDNFKSEASCSDEEYFQCFKDKSSKYPTTLEEFDEHCRRELHAVRCGIDLLERCPNSRYSENLDSLEEELELKEWMCKRFRDSFKN